MDMTRKLTKAFIEMYWERKCLWQVRSEDYKIRDVKKKAYAEIVAFLRRNGVQDADEKLVRYKIQNLRRAMRKEKRKIEESGGTYSPTLWYYDLLTFVSHQYEETSKNSSVPNVLDEDCDFSFDEEDQKEEASRNPPPSVTDPLTIKPVALEPSKPDEFEAMGINVAAKVRRMAHTQQIYAELLIQKVLARGLLGQLGETTEVVDLVPENGVVRLGQTLNVDAYRKVSNDSFVNRSA